MSSVTESAEPIPLMHFRTDHLPAAEARDQWCQLMAPLFHIEQSRFTGTLPRGNLTVLMVGEIMVSRNTFNAQHLYRDKELVATTPAHLVLQYYRSGGFRGVIAGRPVCISRGEVAVADLSQELDADAATSNTVGLSIPRSLLSGIDPMAFRLQLDKQRNRILGGYMATLPGRLMSMNVNEIPTVVATTIALLRRVFDLGSSFDPDRIVSNEESLLDRVLQIIEADIAVLELSPAYLAERARVSRASLYRLFAPMGGIMHYVHERRLQAVRNALCDSLERRTLANSREITVSKARLSSAEAFEKLTA